MEGDHVLHGLGLAAEGGYTHLGAGSGSVSVRTAQPAAARLVRFSACPADFFLVEKHSLQALPELL